MVLVTPWLILAAGVAALLAVALGVLWGARRSRPSTSGDVRPVARAERLRSLTSVSVALRRRVVAGATVVAVGVIAVLVSGVIAARPQSSELLRPAGANRDVLLCLDVSGSMSDVVEEVADAFLSLAEDFKGERIGLTIFNSTPVQVFPLTDDYEFVHQELVDFRAELSGIDEYFLAGTDGGVGSSLVSDGLAACTLGFDHAGTERSRSIVLATDNDARGESIVSMKDAAGYATANKIRVYAINPAAGVDEAQTEELVGVAQQTGGEAYELRDTTSVSDIVARVQQQQATQLQGAATVVWTDTPQLWVAIIFAVILSFIGLLWWVRL